MSCPILCYNNGTDNNAQIHQTKLIAQEQLRKALIVDGTKGRLVSRCWMYKKPEYTDSQHTHSNH